jgi:endo-1,4-beta-xylanase
MANIIPSLKKTLPLLGVFSLIACARPAKIEKESLQKAYENKFLIGAALNESQILEKDTASIFLLKKHFNSIVAENCMKSEIIQPEQGRFDFALADKFVELGEKNNMFIVGHTLVWHSQTPSWFFIDENGNDVSRDTLIERMRKHITTLVSRYKGRVDGWDVVNEAITDDGQIRQSKWYNIIGEDFIELAFKFASEADPDAELYYNDYSLPKPEKRDGVIRLIKALNDKGVHVDAIGMQGHYTLNFPNLQEFEDAIVAFAELGTKVMITELDITVLPHPTKDVSADINQNYEIMEGLNPYKKHLPDSVQILLENRYVNLFQILLDHNESVSRVTFWGITDGQSWRNYWPIIGRTDYPLLFDRAYNEKNTLSELIKLVSQ